MTELGSRIKKARTDLHLSQEYVAGYLGIGRSAVAEIESGRRGVKADELGKLSDLFLISADHLLKGSETSTPSQMFARGFDQLDEADQQEILNLIKFKRAMKEKV
ncbi:helix-turn-helix domain-containing protein [Adlercreutzia sp. ZJ141]|uniref:helix-turn-helix domain-containing protein n=1 Tax=Adlercreutzia sp. ZJ141 TaxID=2709406 RepID=UPI001981E0BD|nr:helix-turn-helix transcriptional regulator [Adlercreutzia sp. ZJ141]